MRRLDEHHKRSWRGAQKSGLLQALGVLLPFAAGTHSPSSFFPTFLTETITQMCMVPEKETKFLLGLETINKESFEMSFSFPRHIASKQ